LEFSRDGSMLLGAESLQEDPKVVIWDTATWEVKQTFTGHTDTITEARFTPDLRQVITASWDGSLRVWDVASGKAVLEIDKAHDGRVYCAVIPVESPQPVVVSCSADETVSIWNYRTGEKLRTIKFDRQIREVAVDSKGLTLLAASIGEHVNAWIAVVDAASGKVRSRYEGHNRSPRPMVLSRDDDTVYSAGGFRHEIDQWSVSSGQRIRRLTGNGGPVEAVGISPDGNTVYWGSEPIDWSGKRYDFDKPASLSMAIDLKTVHDQLGTPRPMQREDTKILRTVRKAGRLSLERSRPPDGRFYSILEIKEGRKTIGKIERDARTGHIHTAHTFTPDGELVVSGGEVGYLSLHRLNGEQIGDFEGHNGDITDLAVSADGNLLVSGSRDQTFKIWNMETQELLLSFFVADNGQWIAWTATGHYTSSPDGDRYIGWVINQGAERNADYVQAEQMRKKLYRPDVIQKVLESRSLDTALSTSPETDFSVAQVQESKVIPVDFAIASPRSGFETEQESIDLEIQVSSNDQGAITWAVNVNDRQVLNRAAADRTLSFPVNLDPGENLVRVIGDNNETQKETSITVVRTVPEKVVAEPESTSRLLTISVGVDAYVNMPQHNLDYASADADAIAGVFIEQEGRNYDSVKTVLLSDNSDRMPTRDNVIQSLNELGELRATDTVILFLAGHGVLEGTDYYFLPRDAKLDSSGRWDKSTVVPWEEIQRAMQSSLGRRILLVDTCYSESAFNSRLIKDAEDSNIIVMSSTDAATLAQEIAELEHGVFTYALLSGIGGEADSFKDGKVTMTELNAFVSNAVPSITKNAQIPTLSVPGGFQDFVIASL
jgi:WD40 repeat protein